MIFYNHLPDGSYVEATGGYNTGAFSGYKNYKTTMLENGVEVSPEYDEMLHKAAYYNALLYAPDGSGLQYGDSSPGLRDAGLFKDIYEWYNDKELEYITTYGSGGTKPPWTSRHWSDSTVTAMRADWSRESPYLFTNVRGGGQHGHSDYNGLIVYAYGRTLLNDAGIFTYTSSDPYRQWGLSSTAHNTVVINDRSQNRDSNGGHVATGTVHDFMTNSAFDCLSQSTPQTPGFTHRRTITFIKPNLWIVSDLMIPEKEGERNNYKQVWHMLPESGLSTSEKDKTIVSNYESGANIIVASADNDDVEVKEEMGWFDRSYQQLEKARYGYFEKDNIEGNASFDTVLVPTDNDPDAQVNAEALDLNVEKSTATALKLTSYINGEKSTGYYYLSYEEDPQAESVFGKYVTDGEMAYISEQENGTASQLIARNASFVREDGNDKALVLYSGKIKNISIEQSGDRMDIQTSDTDLDYSGLKILAPEGIHALYINGTKHAFKLKDGYLMISDEEPSIEELIEGYIKDGQLNSDLGDQLLYRVSIIHTMEDQKQFAEAVNYLKDLRSYISAPAVLQQGLITEEALDVINAKAQEWIEGLQAG